MTQVRVAQVHYPVTVLGPGRRYAIWFQGCTIGCRGCMSRDTWDPAGGSSMPVETLVAKVASLRARGLEGVTISGGEPFEQPEALENLLVGLRAAMSDSPGIDILCYTGKPLAEVRARHPVVLSLLDAIIPEPYEARMAPEQPWRGSSNQPCVPLSELGQRLYSAVPDTALPLIQIGVSDGRMTLVGIPRPGDLVRLERLMSQAGVELRDVSWRP